MSAMDREGEGTGRLSMPWSRDAGPEPEWAEAIRQGRRARGDRLRDVFSTFGDDGVGGERAIAREPGSSSAEERPRGHADDEAT